MVYHRRRRAALLFLRAFLFGLVVLLAACDGSPPPAVTEPVEEALTPQWYLFTPAGGEFQSLKQLEAFFPTPPELMLPWVNQIRFTEFFLHQGSLLLGINGYGLGAVRFDPDPRLELFPDSVRFAGRTLGGLFESPKGVMIHLYEDMVFSDPSPGPTVPLHLFNPREERFSTLPAGRDFWSQGWSLVDLFPREEGYLEQWKKAEEGEILFSYQFRGNPAEDEAVRELSQDEFRQLYRPVYLDQVITEVQDAWKLIGWNEDEMVMRDLLFPRGSVLPGEVRTRRIDPDQVESYERIPAFFDNRGLAILDGLHDRLWSSEGGGRYVSLPELPRGCVFTGLAGSAEWWILGWEERVFPQVGRAGLLFLPR
jgi:hypothetical protein